MNPFVLFILGSWFVLGVFFVGLFCCGYFLCGVCHTGYNGECFGKGVVILFNEFGITGPSVSEEHVQRASAERHQHAIAVFFLYLCKMKVKVSPCLKILFSPLK